MIALPELLQTSFAVSQADIEKATSFQRKYGGQLEQILVSMGSLSAETLPDIYAALLSLPRLTEDATVDWQLPEAAKQLPVAALADKGWLPFSVNNNLWCFVTNAPLNKDAQEMITALALDCTLLIAGNEQFSKLVTLSQQHDDTATGGELTSLEEARLRELASEAPDRKSVV